MLERIGKHQDQPVVQRELYFESQHNQQQKGPTLDTLIDRLPMLSAHFVHLFLIDEKGGEGNPKSAHHESYQGFDTENATCGNY